MQKSKEKLIGLGLFKYLIKAPSHQRSGAIKAVIGYIKKKGS